MRAEEIGINLQTRKVYKYIAEIVEEYGSPNDPTECWKRVKDESGNEFEIHYLDFHKGSLSKEKWEEIKEGSILIFEVSEQLSGFSLAAG